MELVSLTVKSLPGIAQPIEQDFAPGANFVIGPNAIGKSSLARALFFLLGEKQAGDPPGLVLEARFRDGDQEWFVERNANSIQWYLDGMVVERPALPTQEALRCYWLTAESLLPPRDADHNALHQRFREALAGGINLAQVKQESALEDISFPRSEFTRYKEAQEARKDLERRYQNLQAERERLPELEAELSKAANAAIQVEQLKKSLSLLQARRERLKQQEIVDGFDPHLEKLRGDEPAQAQQLIENGRKIDQKLASLKQEQKAVTTTLSQTGLMQAQPESAELETWQQSLREMQTHRHTLESAQQRLNSARLHVEHLRTQLGADTTEGAPIISAAFISQLENTLAQEAKTAEPVHASRRWMYGLIGFGGSVSLLLGIWLTNILMLLAGTATLVGLGGLRLLRSTVSQKAPQPGATIDDLLKTHHLDQAPYQDMGIVRWLDLARQLDTAEKQASEAHADCIAAEAKISELNTALQNFLLQWQTEPSGKDETALEAALASLISRTNEAKTQLNTLTQIQARIEDAQSEAEAQQAAEAQWEALTRLDPHANAQIQALHETHQSYKAALAHLRDCEVTENERRRELSDQAALLSLVAADNQAALETELANQIRLSESVETLQTQYSDLRAAINQALESNALTEAIAEETASKENLADIQSQHRMIKAGQWLLDTVEKSYQQAHEPALAKAAKARFEAFTHGNWSLAFNQEQEVVAKDLISNKQRTLDALSSATRMQLLLAARIAWAQDQERLTRPLPFILDEALGNSDPQRFTAAVQSLEQLINAEHRQIIYLSARPEDLSLWKASAESALHTIDLGAERRASAQPESYAVPEPAITVPAPENDSPAEYAQRLGVPGIQTDGNPSRIHLFHLLRDDLPTLYQVMNDWSLQYWGPAEHWIELRQTATSEPLPAWAETLQRRGEIAKRWQKLAHQGRGKPVNQAVLENCEAVSSTMLPRVTKVAEDCHGNATQLIENLNNKAVAGFRQDKIKHLEQELIQNGHLDPNPTLEDESIIQELLATLGHRLPAEEVQNVTRWLNAARISQASAPRPG
ncbi:MAG: hypothetical protein KGY57_01420 [Gammaproteobacteria bacterium]|nr:hypothetical protein [Gammaproteobacteria bacterium]